jgi:subtilisin family serine protease
MACQHGTFVAGVLSAKRGTSAPAICPDCTLLVYPIFSETASSNMQVPSARPGELAAAILACIDSGANVLNLSVAPASASMCRDGMLEGALDQAAKRNVLVVAAAGNGGTVGSTAITRHPWVIPVMACDLHGRPANESNLSHSIARRGVRAPGRDIASLGPQDEVPTLSGTSVAAPFVTGTLALLWSVNLTATAAQIRHAVLQSAPRGRSVVAPLLDAWSAYRVLAQHERSNRP